MTSDAGPTCRCFDGTGTNRPVRADAQSSELSAVDAASVVTATLMLPEPPQDAVI